MKNAYIFFSNNPPADSKTILEPITHFCREHNLAYRILTDKDCETIRIDGNDYTINLLEKTEAYESKYWMIYCSLKGSSSSVH